MRRCRPCSTRRATPPAPSASGTWVWARARSIGTATIKPGPLEIGFDYSFIMPATGDRVPCVYLDNHRVVGLDPKDPIEVGYGKKVGNEPTGREHPEMLKMAATAGQGHDGTIVNGIGRIGYMSGGKAARWNDETLAATLTGKACKFIENNKDRPFFLYFATHDIHVPRVPAPQFRGSSGCGVRGDVIQQFDWTVGEVVATLDRLALANNTLLIVTSDNGPVLIDGYDDDADQDFKGSESGRSATGREVHDLGGGHARAGGLRWPGRIKAGAKSDALICQVDMLASFAALAVEGAQGRGPGQSQPVAGYARRHAQGPCPSCRAQRNHGASQRALEIHSAAKQPRELYDLDHDIGETTSVSGQHPDVVEKIIDVVEENPHAGQRRTVGAGDSNWTNQAIPW